MKRRARKRWRRPDEMKPPVDLETIAMLEYGTYDTGWVRWLNGAWDIPILDVEGVSQFPFRTVSLPGRVTMALLEDLEFVGALIKEYDLHIDEAALQGLCDTERMRKYQSSDVICIPGTSVMEPGMVITVIYHPESFIIVALTTTIDNIGGYATRADEWRDLLVVAPAEDGAPQPQGDGCGPLGPGQWISAADYQQQGLNLPISTAGFGGLRSPIMSASSRRMAMPICRRTRSRKRRRRRRRPARRAGWLGR